MKKVSEAVRDDEAERLGVLYETRNKLSNADFAEKYGLASAQMVWQYTSGHRPLNLAAAARFANGLDVPIAAFSKRLARELDDLLRLAQPGASAMASETMSAISLLDGDARRRLENIVRAFLDLPPIHQGGGQQEQGQHSEPPAVFRLPRVDG